MIGKQPLNSTPIRSRQLPQQENGRVGYATVLRHPAVKTERSVNHNENTVIYESKANFRDVSPKQGISITPKPLSSLALTTPKKSQYCNNHPHKEAEYQIQLQDDLMYYCERCSALLASQGFQVVRLQQKVSSANQSTGSHLLSPASSSPIESNPRYSEIKEFCGNARNLVTENEQSADYLRSLQTHYLQQEQLIEEFHNGMIHYLNQVKQQHLKMIRGESRKFLQIADIERGEIEDCAVEVQDILQDIETNVTDIVSTLSQERYREVMGLYQQKLSLFGHQAEQRKQMFEGITQLERRDLEKKLAEFGRLMSQFFSNQEPSTFKTTQTNKNSASNKKMCAQNEKLIRLAKLTGSNDRERGPFRNLRFEQSDVIESPVFREL